VIARNAYAEATPGPTWTLSPLPASTIATAAERHRGYIDELADQGIHIDERLVRLDLRGIEKAEAAVMELLSVSPAPTALFTGQNLITIGAFRALRRLGLH